MYLKNAHARWLLSALSASIMLSACGGSEDSASSNSSSTTPGVETKLAATTVYSRARPALPIPTPMNGVTLDSIGNLSAVVTSLKSISKVPTTRIVFDEFVAASYYQNATKQIRDVSYVMGELLDSMYVKQYSVQAYVDRAKEYVTALGNDVDIWEIGNEINGEWVGNTPDVVAKMTGAYDYVKSQGKTTELTLYYNQDCWSNPANEMFTWAQNNVPDRMKQGLDYVLVSFYEDDCNGIQPDWNQVFTKLHAMFPNSQIGFGETGTKDTTKKASYITRYYSKQLNVPNYVGGYFWWYFHPDMIPNTQPLLQTLNSAIASVPDSSSTSTSTASSTSTTTSTPSTSTTTATPSTSTTTATPSTATTTSTTSGAGTISSVDAGSAAQTVPTTSGYWTTQYNGYGTVTYDATKGIGLNPKAPTKASETHAALTLANNLQLRNFHLTVTATTDKQTRLNSAPNPWETFWIFFNYLPTASGKSTNYFLLKPNGVELGTAVDANGQNFLYTGAANAQAIGASNTYDIEKVGNHVTVSINGRKVTDYTGAVIDVAGSIGLYSEDSNVRVTKVQLTPLP